MMIKKILKILFGVMLVPFCVGFSWQLAATVFTVHYRPDTPYYFLAGGLTYLSIHILFKKPVLTYVIGHELTHALFATFFGGSIKSIHASNRGGRVTLTKSNFVITLAPYFFPLYTSIALVLYWGARAAHAHGMATDVLIFLSGATFALHLLLTFVFLQTDQNDIREEGAMFSYPLIFLFNIAFAAFLMKVYLVDNMDYLGFLANGIIRTLSYLYIGMVKTYAFIHAS
jgi:hypothetical protein